ncbi:hypothetical protein J6590_075391 [Homalodisca vitripennis]|nr:hypothetical protein J6590_075391 [Homalodisca vitripennis]
MCVEHNCVSACPLRMKGTQDLKTNCDALTIIIERIYGPYEAKYSRNVVRTILKNTEFRR